LTGGKQELEMDVDIKIDKYKERRKAKLKRQGSSCKHGLEICTSRYKER
jgi:hypothetical protein